MSIRDNIVMQINWGVFKIINLLNYNILCTYCPTSQRPRCPVFKVNVLWKYVFQWLKKAAGSKMRASWPQMIIFQTVEHWRNRIFEKELSQNSPCVNRVRFSVSPGEPDYNPCASSELHCWRVFDYKLSPNWLTESRDRAVGRAARCNFYVLYIRSWELARKRICSRILQAGLRALIEAARGGRFWYDPWHSKKTRFWWR